MMNVMDISWIRPEQLVEFELIQLADENVDTGELKRNWEQIKSRCSDAAQLREAAQEYMAKLELARSEAANPDVNHFFEKLKTISEPDNSGIDAEALKDKIKGGWFGRASGCLLGKPIEKYSREIIKKILLTNNSWPLEDYITAEGLPPDILNEYPWNRHSGFESLRENIVCMPEDDDLNYTMLNLSVLEKYGLSFTTENIAQTWLNTLPALSTFTAERVAYKNLLLLKDINEVALYQNPYREWIGAMIRADVWGWANPGRPLKAAKAASVDAALSHTRNGIYGAMYLAAAISLCFKKDDIESVLTDALEYIPESSISEAVRFSLDTARKYSDREKILDCLHEHYGRYNWVHSVNNMALIAASLAYGNGDYEKTICMAVMGGWDTDSDGATVGAIAGTLLGYKKLPQKWINPLADRIRTSLAGYDNHSITGLAERTAKIACSDMNLKMQ